MKSLSSLLAWRYLTGTRKEKSISTMVIICFIGIFIGSFALAIVLSVMNGFEKVTHEKLQGIHAQLIMRAGGKPLDTKKIGALLEKEFPQVANWSPSAIKQVIIQPDHSDDISNVVMVKGIDPVKEEKISAIANKIILPPKQPLSYAVGDNFIVIGHKLAASLGVLPGDTVSLLYMKEYKGKGRRVSLDKTNATIGGIFDTGIDEFDSGLLLASLPFLHTIFPDADPTQININLTDNADEAQVTNELKKRFNIDVYSWKDLYPALVAALKLEKYAMFFILALIILVASTNIISLLFMQITQKRADIAILKAMGARNGSIMAIFLKIGLSISLAATTCGLLAAYAVGWLLQTYPFIRLPDTYYVSHLPIKMELHLFALVFIVVLLISFISTLLPALGIKSIRVADVLRFEA